MIRLLLPLFAIAFAVVPASAQDADAPQADARSVAEELPTQAAAKREILTLAASLQTGAELEAARAASRAPSSDRVSIRSGLAISAASERMRILSSAAELGADDLLPDLLRAFENELRTAAEADPAAAVSIAHALHGAGRTGEAIALLRDVTQRVPSADDFLSAMRHQTANLDAARAFLEFGDPASARETVRQMMADSAHRNAFSLYLRLRAAQVLADAGDPAGALRALHTQLAADGERIGEPVFEDGVVFATLQFLDQMNTEPATRARDAIIAELHPDRAGQVYLWLTLAGAHHEAGRADMTRRAARRALALILDGGAPPLPADDLSTAARLLALSGDCALALRVQRLAASTRMAVLMMNTQAGDGSETLQTGPEDERVVDLAIVQAACGLQSAAVDLVRDEANRIGRDLAEALPAGMPSEPVAQTYLAYQIAEIRDLLPEARREALSRAVSVSLPREAALPSGAGGALAGDGTSLALMWVDGALARGRRHEAEALLLDLYNGLPEEPAARISGLLALRPYLPD
jgi:hypothetical protein